MPAASTRCRCRCCCAEGLAVTGETVREDPAPVLTALAEAGGRDGELDNAHPGRLGHLVGSAQGTISAYRVDDVPLGEGRVMARRRGRCPSALTAALKSQIWFPTR